MGNCWKCGGTGYIGKYKAIQNGICFACGGDGNLSASDRSKLAKDYAKSGAKRGGKVSHLAKTEHEHLDKTELASYRAGLMKEAKKLGIKPKAGFKTATLKRQIQEALGRDERGMSSGGSSAPKEEPKPQPKVEPKKVEPKKEEPKPTVKVSPKVEHKVEPKQPPKSPSKPSTFDAKKVYFEKYGEIDIPAEHIAMKDRLLNLQTQDRMGIITNEDKRILNILKRRVLKTYEEDKGYRVPEEIVSTSYPKSPKSMKDLVVNGGVISSVNVSTSEKDNEKEFAQAVANVLGKFSDKKTLRNMSLTLGVKKLKGKKAGQFAYGSTGEHGIEMSPSNMNLPKNGISSYWGTNSNANNSTQNMEYIFTHELGHAVHYGKVLAGVGQMDMFTQSGNFAKKNKPLTDYQSKASKKVSELAKANGLKKGENLNPNSVALYTNASLFQSEAHYLQFLDQVMDVVPSYYSLTDENELFAETFALYTLNPQRLKTKMPELYTMMKNYLGGVEF